MHGYECMYVCTLRGTLQAKKNSNLKIRKSSNSHCSHTFLVLVLFLPFIIYFFFVLFSAKRSRLGLYINIYSTHIGQPENRSTNVIMFIVLHLHRDNERVYK